jgi:hypothetical protein
MLDAQIEQFFPFDVPVSTIAPETIEQLLHQYALERDSSRKAPPESGNTIFLGSKPIIQKSRENIALYWRWRLEDCIVKINSVQTAQALKTLLETTSRTFGMDTLEFYERLKHIANNETERIWNSMRNNGLVIANC